jgi:hypothetical protein
VQVQDVFAIETSGYEEMQMTVMLTELTGSMDRIKRNYKTITIYMTLLKAQLHVGQESSV